MLSTTTMLDRVRGLLGTKDLSPWEHDFVRSLADRADAGQITQLSGRQVEALQRLHDKHFAG